MQVDYVVLLHFSGILMLAAHQGQRQGRLLYHFWNLMSAAQGKVQTIV